jgi:replicative DNA helicase
METQPSPRPGSMTLTIDPPFALEAEHNAIGLVLAHPVTWTSFARLRPEDFFDPTNALIWSAIAKLRSLDMPAHLPAVFAELAPQFGGYGDDKAKRLNDFLTGCVLSVVTEQSHRETALTLHEMAGKRRLARTMAQFAKRLSTSGMSDSASTIGGDMVRQIQLDQGTDLAMIDAGDIVQKIIDNRYNPVRISSTGWNRLNKALLGGFVENFYYVFTGRPKGLKTTTLISMAYDMIVRDDPIPIDYYCLESTADQVFKKMLARWVSEVWCMQNEPKGFCVTDGIFFERSLCQQPWFWEAMAEARTYFKDRGLRFLPQADMNLDDLASAITSAGVEGRTRGSIVDYAQLIVSPQANKGQINETQHLDRIHRKLAALAVNTPQWIIGAVQRNPTGGVRGGEGAIQSASMVINIHSQEAEHQTPGTATKYEAYFEIPYSRYTPPTNIGNNGKEEEDAKGNIVRNKPPAYRLDNDIGPCLREIPFKDTPEGIDQDLRSLRR